MAKFMSTPPAGQSPGMAIQNNPYASDKVAGYNMFTGDYEQTKEDVWSKLIEIISGMGGKTPARQEFDQYYDSMAQGAPNLGSENPGGNPLFPKEERTPSYQEQSAANWKRILDSIKTSGPTPAPGRASMEDNAPIPEPDMMDKPLTADYATREEYEKALREWEIGQGYLD